MVKICLGNIQGLPGEKGNQGQAGNNASSIYIKDTITENIYLKDDFNKQLDQKEDVNIIPLPTEKDKGKILQVGNNYHYVLRDFHQIIPQNQITGDLYTDRLWTFIKIKITDIQQPISLNIDNDIIVDWGDGYRTQSVFQHYYQQPGFYIIVVFGDIQEIYRNAEILYIKTGLNSNLSLQSCNNFSNLTNIYLYQDTTQETSFNSLCENNINLTFIKFFDTDNIINTSKMFYNCKKIQEILPFNTEKVIDMSYMFYNCESLYFLPYFNTSNVKTMDHMLYNCINLTHINKWDISNVFDMRYLFYNCKRLEEIPAWDLKNVIHLDHFVDNCTLLTEFNAYNINSNLDISTCLQLSEGVIETIINNLYPQLSDKKKILTLGELKKRITQEQVDKASQKGWIIN